MNQFPIPVHPTRGPLPILAAASWDLLARELSEEWCGMEPDREETSQQRGQKWDGEETNL